MRYHYEKPSIYLSMCGSTYIYFAKLTNTLMENN